MNALCKRARKKKAFKSNVALGSFLKHMQDKAHQKYIQIRRINFEKDFWSLTSEFICHRYILAAELRTWQ